MLPNWTNVYQVYDAAMTAEFGLKATTYEEAVITSVKKGLPFFRPLLRGLVWRVD